MATGIEDLTARAKELIAERSYQDAVRACRRVLLSRPDETPVRILLGMALLALRRYDEVRAEMMAVLRTQPEEASAHRLLGESYLRGGSPHKARECVFRALELDPSDDEARELMAEIEEETAPVSATIDRWFDPEAVATVQTTPPPFQENDETGQVAALAALMNQNLATARTDVGDGADAASDVDPDALPLESEPTRAAPMVPTPVPGRRGSSTIPPPPQSTSPAPGSAGPPKRATFRRPSAPPGASHPGSSFPPPPRVPSSVPPASSSSFPPPAEGQSSLPPPAGAFDAHLEQSTAAQRPGALRIFDRPEITDELSLDEISEVDSMRGLEDLAAAVEAMDDSVEELEGEPTQARAGPFGEDDSLDEHPTMVRDGFDDLEAEQTVARPESRHEPNAQPYREPYPEPYPQPYPQQPPPSYPEPRPAPQLDQSNVPLRYRFPSSGSGHPQDRLSAGTPSPFDGAPASPPYADPSHFPDDALPSPFQVPSRPDGEQPLLSGAMPAGTPASPRAQPQTPTPHTMPSTGQVTPHAVPSGGRKKLGGNRTALWLAVAIVPVLLGLAAFIGVRVWMESSAEEAVAAAVAQASDDGLQRSLEEAIAVAEKHALDEPEDLALRARLLSTAVLEHGADRSEDVRALLSELSQTDASLPDARVAEAYLRLSRGDVQGAQGALETASGENAELWRARALSFVAANDVGRAVPAARSAVAARPTSPRHVSLLALTMALNRDTAAAIEALDGVPDGDRSPAVRLARARILLESGRDPRTAAAQAEALIEELGDVASGQQKAWAHLLRARHAASSGDEQLARREAESAAELRPRWDEGFALSLAETFLRVAAPGSARDVLATLPEQSQEPQRRARVQAEVAVANGDFDAAEEALGQTEADDAQTAYLRGRIREAGGKLDEARSLYRRAMEDPSESLRARARLGAIALEGGDADKAVELLEPVVEREPAHPEVVPVLVRALIATESLARAAAVIELAQRHGEGTPDLLAMKAQVELAQGNADAALSTFREVVEQRPDDPDLRVAMGDAARSADEADVAREAYEKALELREDHPPALLGLLQLAVDGGDEEAVATALERAEEADVSGPAIDRVRAQILVTEGKGAEAIGTLERLADANEDDAALWVALGNAQMQAEKDREATRSFQRALRIDDDDVEAHLGLALLQTRAGALHRVTRSIGAAERTIQRRNLGPRYEARVFAARGRLNFELGDFSDATENAEKAIEKDSKCSEAHLLLANIAIEQGDDPIPHLRAAVAGRAPLPEALGRLSVRLPRGREACDLARRYMSAAPNGYDASDVEEVLSRCR